MNSKDICTFEVDIWLVRRFSETFLARRVEMIDHFHLRRANKSVSHRTHNPNRSPYCSPFSLRVLYLDRIIFVVQTLRLFRFCNVICYFSSNEMAFIHHKLS